MASDRARVSYDPSRKYRSLVAQQGRVTVEADWNEATAIGDVRDGSVTLDVVGPVGTPDGGYAVTALGSGDLQIGDGTLYLGGERLDLDTTVTYSAQPDWLDYSTDPLWVAPGVPTSSPAYELVWLLAAEQEVSAVEDAALADVALGGPDTMQRQRILQHFVRQATTATDCQDAWAALQSFPGLGGVTSDPTTMRLESTSLLQVTLPGTNTTPSLCQPVATGGYLGAENQMIRVMVSGITNGVPTIVWGFDDASFLYRVTGATYDSTSQTTTVTLASAPVDQYHYPLSGQTVELLRDAVALYDVPSQTTTTNYIAQADGAGWASTLASTYTPMQLVINGQPPTDFLSPATQQLYVRIWQNTTAAPSGVATALGDLGVSVTLTSTNSTFHVGDWWRFSLRPLDPTIVYPARYVAAAQPPDGPLAWACPLAMLTWEDGSATVSPCVPPFDNLVQLTEQKGGCCTVDVGPGDVDNGAGLADLIYAYADTSPVTICLEPGTYTLDAPIVLDSTLDGITLLGCRDGVVLQGPDEPGEEFLLGLISAEGVQSATVSGISFNLPLVPFSPGSDSFTGLPGPNQTLMNAYAQGLEVSIGISASNTVGLTVRDCTFLLPSAGESNQFGAGIFATGVMDQVGVTGCTFESASPPSAAPFYDLAVGNQTEPPYQLTIGYLQIPTFVTERGFSLNTTVASAVANRVKVAAATTRAAATAAATETVATKAVPEAKTVEDKTVEDKTVEDKTVEDKPAEVDTAATGHAVATKSDEVVSTVAKPAEEPVGGAVAEMEATDTARETTTKVEDTAAEDAAIKSEEAQAATANAATGFASEASLGNAQQITATNELETTRQILHDAAIEGCVFEGLTLPVLVLAQLGTIRLDRNTARNAYGGFWFVSLVTATDITLLDAIATGTASIYREFADVGLTALADRIWVMATSIGRILPSTPPISGLFVPGKILFATAAQATHAQQVFAKLYQPAGANAAAGSAASGSAGAAPPAPAAEPAETTATAAKPTATAAKPAETAAKPAAATDDVAHTTTTAEESSNLKEVADKPLPENLTNAFDNLGANSDVAAVPVSDPGTSVTLRFDFSDSQVDAVVADSYSGAALVVIDFTSDASSALVHDSRFRNRFPKGQTALVAGILEGAVGGNIVTNEIVPPDKVSEEVPPTLSMVLSPQTGNLAGPAVVVMGNMFIDPPILPLRLQNIPVALQWVFLNTVLDYVAPPAS